MRKPFPRPPRDLAFIDLETTGLGPTRHRIAEIGVVTLDSDGSSSEWGTLVNTGRATRGQRVVEGVSDQEMRLAPRFADIAPDLVRRLEGRLLVAHNARFDHAFLKCEFARAGIQLAAQSVCTVMLSRKFDPGHESHTLDALSERHGLTAEVRHRALPDARLLYQFWQVLSGEVAPALLWATVDKLLAEPLLPPHLDLDLILALPEKPGVYAMRDREGRALRIARAANLRREVKDYFRLDRISATGAKLSYAVRNIEWQEAGGELSARLAEIALAESESEPGAATRATNWSIRVDPQSQWQVAATVPAEEMVARGQVLFGLYASERKARNALAKLANARNACHGLLGLERSGCRLCGADAGACMRSRPQNLVRALTAVSALRLQPWPYGGPVGVREGRTVHVFDQWQLLGSAKTAPEIADLVHLRPRGFNHAIFNLLSKALPRLGGRRLKTLRRPPDHAHDPARPV